MAGSSVTHFRTCPLCEAMCGLAVSVDGDRITAVRPDPDDVWSRGYVCPKGATLGHLHHDPDRLRAPLLRDGAGWREVGWEEAFRRCDVPRQPGGGSSTSDFGGYVALRRFIAPTLTLQLTDNPKGFGVPSWRGSRARAPRLR